MLDNIPNIFGAKFIAKLILRYQNTDIDQSKIQATPTSDVLLPIAVQYV